MASRVLDREERGHLEVAQAAAQLRGVVGPGQLGQGVGVAEGCLHAGGACVSPVERTDGVLGRARVRGAPAGLPRQVDQPVGHRGLGDRSAAALEPPGEIEPAVAVGRGGDDLAGDAHAHPPCWRTRVEAGEGDPQRGEVRQLATGLEIAIVTEMLIGAPHGLGVRALDAQLSSRTDVLWLVLLLSGALGAGLSAAVRALERRLVWWIAPAT